MTTKTEGADKRYIKKAAKSNAPAVCDRPTHPALETWIRQCKYHVFEAARRNNSLFHAKPSAYSNVSPLVRLAFRILRSSEWRPVPADKDNGYVLAQLEHLQAAQEESLIKPNSSKQKCYVEISPHSIPKETITRHFHKIIQQLPKSWMTNPMNISSPMNSDRQR